jgi:hypothetical protein
MTVNDDLWNKIREGYKRLQIWLKATALQLELKSNWGKNYLITYSLCPSFNNSVKCI